MPEPDLIELFVFPLERLRFQYLVGGSVAAMLYSDPRLTNDIHLIISLHARQIPQLQEIFTSPDFYLPPVEIISAEAARECRGHFNVIHTSSGLKADFYLSNRDQLHAWAFQNARQFQIKGMMVRLVPPEYIIVRKLEYFREGGSDKHLRDIWSMLTVLGDQLDRVVLNDWIVRQGVQEQWQLI